MQSEIGILESLSDRVSRLERQNRRLKQLGVLALLALGSVFLMGQAKTAKAPPVKAVKPQEAGRFVLKDSLGRTRAELGLFADRPALVLYDYAANRILSLGAEPDGAGLTLYDANNDKTAALNYGPAGPVLTLFSGGAKRLNLSVTAQGPALGLIGKKNQAKAALGLMPDDNPFLHLFGSGERGGAQLAVSSDRTVLRFFDGADRARAVLGILEKESAPGLVLNDSAGTARAIMMLTAAGPGIEFFDQNRVRTWVAR
jgi:hypothetical protein